MVAASHLVTLFECHVSEYLGRPIEQHRVTLHFTKNIEKDGLT